MTITIAPHPAGYCVTAELPSGLAHDFFKTQAEAIDFATEFYGGTVETVPPSPPAASALADIRIPGFNQTPIQMAALVGCTVEQAAEVMTFLAAQKVSA